MKVSRESTTSRYAACVGSLKHISMMQRATLIAVVAF